MSFYDDKTMELTLDNRRVCKEHFGSTGPNRILRTAFRSGFFLRKLFSMVESRFEECFQHFHNDSRAFGLLLNLGAAR